MISTSRGEQIIVDPEDFEWASEKAWSLSNSGYAYTRLPRVYFPDGTVKRPSVWMHRMIMERHDLIRHPEFIIHHINDDKLDNRKENLVSVPFGLNMQAKSFPVGRSPYLGVAWSSQKGKWRARLKVNSQEIHLGFFEDEIEAAKAYDEAIRYWYDGVGRVNFN